jgi:hypothetical protein
MRDLPLLFIFLFWTCGPTTSCRAQALDTIITVTKLPYPEARSADPRVREGLAPSLQAAPASPLEPRELESCIQTRQTRLREAELATLTKSHKKDWLKYLPSLSAGLAPSFRQSNDGSVRGGLSPTLSLGLNSSLIYQAHRDKQQ